MVVLDTVRSDRVQPCGYERPTTPLLDRLSEVSATWCKAILPASWTLPAHASLFTGVLPPVHGADYDDEGVAPPGAADSTKMRGLGPELPTLAEIFRDAGYRTVMVGGNPVLKPPLGLARGFELHWVAPSFGYGVEAAIHPAVRQMLEENPTDGRPWFVFLNVVLAHSPLEAIPEDVDWLPASDALHIISGGRESFYARHFHDELAPGEREEVFARIHDLYDWGVRLADEDLQLALESLRRAGVFDDRTILAVTTDHGELLGEYGLLNHACTLAPEVLDSFVMLKAPGVAAGPRDELVQPQDLFVTLPQLAGLRVEERPHSHSLLDPPPSDRTLVAVSQPEEWQAGLSAGRMGAERLVMVRNGERTLYVAEPADGGSPTWTAEWHGGAWSEVMPAGSEELGSLALDWMRRARESEGATVEMDEELLEALREIGYVE